MAGGTSGTEAALTPLSHEQRRRGDVDRAISSDDDTDQEGEREAMQALATLEVENHDDDEHGEHGQNRSAERLIDAVVDHFGGELAAFCL